MDALLALENGQWFRGKSVGAQGETSGEVVFNTSMTGYQEVLTDPSYAGQIVTMTCPEVGNYGIVPPQLAHTGLLVAFPKLTEAERETVFERLKGWPSNCVPMMCSMSYSP